MDGSAAAHNALRAISDSGGMHSRAACEFMRSSTIADNTGSGRAIAGEFTDKCRRRSRARLINYYFDEATAPPRFRRSPLHDAEFTEQMFWIIRRHPASRALALMAPSIRAGFLSAPGVDSAVAAGLDDALARRAHFPL